METVITIICDKETICITPLEKSLDMFMNSSIVIYGPTNCGKSTFIKVLLYLLRDKYPIVTVYAPNHVSKPDFYGIIPEPLIYTKLTDDFISSVYERQCAIATKYQEANRYDNIQKLFDIVKKTEDDVRMTKLNSKYKSDKGKLIDLSLRYMKSVIRKYHHHLTNPTLINMYKQMRINPRILVVFDDASVKLEDILKSAKKNGVINNFFYEGRHQFITHLYAIHSTTVFPARLRQNTCINIFCHRSCANAWFDNKYNADSYLKSIARLIIDEIFKVPYRILIYYTTGNTFHYMDVKPVSTEFTLCSSKIWEYCNPISKR